MWPGQSAPVGSTAAPHLLFTWSVALVRLLGVVLSQQPVENTGTLVRVRSVQQEDSQYAKQL